MLLFWIAALSLSSVFPYYFSGRNIYIIFFSSPFKMQDISKAIDNFVVTSPIIKPLRCVHTHVDRLL